MDNYNGQNQFDKNQMSSNQYMQVQYIQNQPIIQNTQQTQFQGNGYDVQEGYEKNKNKCFKWLFIIGVPTLIIIILITIWLIDVFDSKYDIDDEEKFMRVTEYVFGFSPPEYSYTGDHGIVSISGLTTRRGDLSISRYQFDSKKSAKVYWNKIVDDWYEDFSKQIEENKNGDWQVDNQFVEAYVEKEGVIYKVVMILQDEYMVTLQIEGDKSIVEKYVKKWLKMLD